MQIIFNHDSIISIDNIYGKYYLFDFTKPLVVTFAPLNAFITSSQLDSMPSPWGFDFMKNSGYNVVSFTCIDNNNWYRSQKFANFLLDSLSPILSKFYTRLGYGGSMGGYGVSAYANILNLQRVLLLNPISSLQKSKVPFETRFDINKESPLWENYSLDGGVMEASGYVVYDPLFSLDRKQAQRYKNLTSLKVPGVGHFMPVHLQNLGILHWVITNFIDNTLEINEFNNKVKDRRKLQQYYQFMLELNANRNTPWRDKVITHYQKKYLKNKY